MKTSSRSFTRWLFHFCGSIKLAMLLLAVLIVATITGTVVESRLDTSVAQSYVYDAPWFMAWLLLLCVNLVGAVLVRYPWKPHQIGFVITHAGIVVILVGAIIGRVWGFEGNITLFKGQEPSNFLLTGRQTLQAKTGSASKVHEMNLSRGFPTGERPEKFKVGEVEITAIEFAPELGLRTHVEKAKSNGAPALRLVMTSAMSQKPFDRWLMLDHAQHGEIEFGPTTISYRSAPAGSEVAANAKIPSRELHFAFAKMPQMNIARLSAGIPTGIKTDYKFDLEQKDADYKGNLEIKTEARTFAFAVSELVGRETPLTGTPYTLKFLNYFAELRMQGKQPVSVSDQPNNPAVLFEILGPLVTPTAPTMATSHQDHGAPANHDGHDHTGHQHDHAAHASTSEFLFFREANGDLKFESRSRNKGSIHGEIKIGQEFSPGLADWKCRVEEVTEHAVVRHELAPLSDDAPQGTGASGLLVELKRGAQTDTRWIRMGTATKFDFAGESIELNFGHKLHTLDFTVGLEKFEVEMNEGTSTPGSFKSYVRFHDPKKETTLTRAVWMNNPANFPQFVGAGLLGTTYKFSQSSWNPNNLDETTLQVIRDPGWSLKWFGSLLLCGGLFTMFYLKPYPRFAQKKSERGSVSRSTPDCSSSDINSEGVLVGQSSCGSQTRAPSKTPPLGAPALSQINSKEEELVGK